MDDSGNHIILDIIGADTSLLKNAHVLHSFFLKLLTESDFHVIDYLTYKFAMQGEGVTGLYLLSESHLSYHTYPENEYISIDIYTCGVKKISLHKKIQTFFGRDARINSRTISRGSKLIKNGA